MLLHEPGQLQRLSCIAFDEGSAESDRVNYYALNYTQRNLQFTPHISFNSAFSPHVSFVARWEKNTLSPFCRILYATDSTPWQCYR